MSNALFELYLKDVFKLARTIVIKSEASAEQLNTRIKLINQPVDEADPSTWKYYLNLAGEYHQVDTPMTVKSLDTLEDIAFTKENLLVHRATKKAYAYGTSYYRALVDQYPKQQQLILGILNPVEIKTAIAAADHQILWYDRTLVEAQETNLITQLQLYIDAWWRKNDSPAYGLYHDLYTAQLYAAFYSQLGTAILGIRLENCHTQYAHSFHIWSYLAGKGNLDDFKEYLNTEQTLWLYRNIEWLTANVGKAKTQAELVEHLMTARGFPIVSYEMLQNTEGMPASLVPEIDLLANPLNFLDQQPRTRTTKTVEEMIEKEIPQAVENVDYTAEAIVNTNNLMRYATVTRVPTKVLESQVVDRSESHHVKLADVLLNHWLYLSNIRRYSAIVTVSNPQTGEAFNISVKDAFVLWLWLFNHAAGYDFLYIPTVVAKRVRKVTMPTLTQLRALVRPKYCPEWLLKLFYDQQPAYGLTVSTAAFNELGRELYNADLEQYSLYTRQENMHSRGDAELAAQAFWQDQTCVLAPEGTTYAQWFKERGLTVEDMNRLDSLTLANDLLDKATGQDLSKQYTLKEIQKAMLSLFERLSSYTIQLIQTISDSPLIPVGFQPIRVGDADSRDRDRDLVIHPGVEVIGDHSKERDLLTAAMVGATTLQGFTSLERDVVKVEPYIDVSTNGPGRDRQRIRLSNLRWSVTNES